MTTQRTPKATVWLSLDELWITITNASYVTTSMNRFGGGGYVSIAGSPAEMRALIASIAAQAEQPVTLEAPDATTG